MMSRHLLQLSTSLALILALCSCQPDPERKRVGHSGGPAATSDPFSFDKKGLTGGELVFQDNFGTSKKLAEHWTPANPKASVRDGWLRIENNKNEPPVWLNVKLPEQVRVEFDVRTRSGDGDIKFEIFGDGENHASGYILVFGAHKNAEDWFARLDEHGADRVTRKPSEGAKKDKVYHMAVVRTDNRARWFIDGKPFMMFDDPKPLRGDKHAYFAVNTWAVPLEFDNIKVFNLAVEEPKK